MFKKNIRQHLALFVAFCMILNFSVPTFAAENGDESDAYDVVDNLDLLDETGEIDEFDETDETGETDETNEDFDLEENLDEELEEDLEELEEEELDPIVISNVTGDNLVVTSADGEVVVIDNERPLQAGDVVSVGSGTRVALQLYTDGPQVLLDSQSNVTLGDGLVPPNLTINSGSVMVNALAGGFPILEVMIGDELVTISGGLFVVEVAEDGTTNVTMLAGSGFINGFPLEPGQVMTLSWDLLEELETLTPEVDLDLDIAEDQDLDNAEDTEESEENLEDLEELEELTEAAVLVFFLNMQVSELDLSTVSLFVLQTIIDFWEVLVEWGVVADDEELYTSIVDRVEELEREAEEAANGGNGGNGDGNVVVRPPQPEIDNETEGDISPPPSAGGGGNGGGNGGQTPEPPRYEEPPEVDGVRQISSTLHLNWLAYHDVSGMDFILMNRIDAGSMVLPLLDGDFNGNNNVIEVGGITNTTASALFGTVTANGTVRDLHVNGSISGGVEGFPAAGIAAFNEGTLDNVFFNGSITGYGGLAGGLVGVARAGSEVLRSGFNGSIASSNGSLGLTTGGIVGNLETGATVSETFVIGTVHIHAFPGAPGNVGGIAGINAGDINNSYSTAQVGGGGNAGGLVGLNNGTLTTSYTVGAVNGGNNTGGLVGLNNGSVSLSIALNPTVDGGLNTNAAVGSGNAATLIFVHPDIRVNGETVNGGNGNGNGGNGNGNGENGNGNGENGNGNGENGNGNGGNGNGNGENGNGNGENGNGNGENGNGNGENGNGNGENGNGNGENGNGENGNGNGENGNGNGNNGDGFGRTDNGNAVVSWNLNDIDWWRNFEFDTAIWTIGGSGNLPILQNATMGIRWQGPSTNLSTTNEVAEAAFFFEPFILPVINEVIDLEEEEEDIEEEQEGSEEEFEDLDLDDLLTLTPEIGVDEDGNPVVEHPEVDETEEVETDEVEEVETDEVEEVETDEVEEVETDEVEEVETDEVEEVETDEVEEVETDEVEEVETDEVEEVAADEVEEVETDEVEEVVADETSDLDEDSEEEEVEEVVLL